MRQSLRTIESEAFDVAVVGCGINGAACARYLAAAGLRVLLIDKDDFASGATSRSSRLIHNGIWYFATDADFWQTLAHPRALLHNIAGARGYLTNQSAAYRSHGHRMLRFTYLIPEGGPNPYRVWQMALGFRALNLATLGRGSVRFRRLRDPGRHLLIRYHRPDGRFPSALAVDDLMADSPERICIDLVLEAEAYGATVANYARLAALHRRGPLWTLGIEDRLHGGTAEVSARLVVNTAGAWAGEVDTMASPSTRRRVEPIKGAHILVKTPEFEPGFALLTYSSDRKEPFFAFPFRGLYMLGNTHTPYQDDLDHVAVTEAEVEHLLHEGRTAFPGAGIDESSIVYTYSGVRPMSLSQGSWALEPRIHDLERQEGVPGMLTLTGAPISTFHGVARRMLALSLRKLGGRAHGPGPSLKEKRNLLALEGIPDEPICEHGRATLREAARGIVEEHAAGLADVLRRRVVHVWSECLGLHAAARVAAVLAPLAGWDAARVDEEVASYTTEVVATFQPRHAGAVAGREVP